MKKFFCVLAVFISLLAAGGALAEADSSDGTYRFFETPEDAILYFAQCVSEADFEGALRANAAKSMAEGYDLKRMVERLQVFSPDMTMRWPSLVHAEYAALNRISQEAIFANQLFGMISSLLIDPELYDGSIHLLKDGSIEIDENTAIPMESLTSALDPARLKNLSVHSIYRFDSEVYLSEMYRENIAKQGAVYGYTDAKEFLAVYQFDGSLYAHPHTVVKFPEGWQISSLNAPFMGTDFRGTVIPVPDGGIESIQSEGDMTKVFEAAQ